MNKNTLVIFLIFLVSISLKLTTGTTVTTIDGQYYNTTYTVIKKQSIIQSFDGLSCTATIIGREKKDGSFLYEPYQEGQKHVYTKFQYPIYLLNKKLETSNDDTIRNDPVLKGLKVSFGINICSCKKIYYDNDHKIEYEYSTFYALRNDSKTYLQFYEFKQLSGNCKKLEEKETKTSKIQPFHFKNHEIIKNNKGRKSITLVKDTERTEYVYNYYTKKDQIYKVHYYLHVYCIDEYPSHKPDELNYEYYTISPEMKINYVFSIYSKAGCPLIEKINDDPFIKFNSKDKNPFLKFLEFEIYKLFVLIFALPFFIILFIIILIVLLNKCKGKKKRNKKDKIEINNNNNDNKNIDDENVEIEIELNKKQNLDKIKTQTQEVLQYPLPSEQYQPQNITQQYSITHY